jgi:hypothetical protein
MAAAESVRIWCGFRYSKLNCCFLLEPWQCPKLRRPTFSVRHFLSDAGECRPVLSVAMSCPVCSKVPQIELVLAHSCRISIVVFALTQALVLNGLMVKSDVYSKAWPLVVALLQFPTDTCDCTRGSLLVINVFSSS